MEALSADFIELAQAMTSAELYNNAFEVFLASITRNPDLAASHRAEVLEILEKLNMELAVCGRMEDIFANFEKAMKIYPNSNNLLYDIGRYLFKFGFYKEAWVHFEIVLYTNPKKIMAEKNLNSVKNLLVERWHFRMLNDNLRNEAYRSAVRDIVIPSDKVIDVGTGTGLLAIYACEAGATDIVACDNSETMVKLAQDIRLRNNLNNSIKIINKMSTAMDCQDLNGKATLLLTEMFDAGLFGEHVLQMLQHAWPNLLSEQARVIPNRAEFFISGAQCNHLNMRYQLSSEAKNLLNLGNENVHVLVTDETYDCEDVHIQRDIKYITEPQSVLIVNFNDIKDIEMHLNRSEPYEVELKVTENGTINILIGWFNIYLTDTITITTNPTSESRANAWQQAVFFDELPRTVQKGDSIKLEFLMNSGHFTLKPSSNARIKRVSPEIVRFLNDNDYMKLIESVIPVASEYLCQKVDMSQVSIVDMCPFPIFGLLIMKRGASSLLCCAKNECDKKFIIKVFKQNKIPLTNVTILLGNEWSIDELSNKKYHVVFGHILEIGGDIDPHLNAIATRLRKRHLHSCGLYMPSHMWIVGQLVSSRWLDINNELFDANVSKFKMAEFVNRYQVNMNYFVDFSTLKYVPLTDPVVISMDLNGDSFKDVLIEKDGYANALLCWYQIELMSNLNIISTNRPNSFMDGMLFMTRCKKSLVTGDEARIEFIRDEEGAVKLILDVDKYL